MKLYVGITDRDWYDILSASPDLEEVNFWSPGGKRFKALSPGELFLFKLRAPNNFIVGGGIFAHDTLLPCSLAWETFGIANGARSFPELRTRIARLRHTDAAAPEDFVIGCRLLTQPFFLPQGSWIPVPDSWAPNIVQGRGYGLDDPEGRALWQAFEARIEQAEAFRPAERYGAPFLVKPRLGQGAFRVVVADRYLRRCAVTGERVLPALDAAHIRPYAEGGAHEVPNGLLLRRDIHGLFDRGYVTVTPDLNFVVSRRIKEEFENGRDYYALHGRTVQAPNHPADHPDRFALTWHSENRFLG